MGIENCDELYISYLFPPSNQASGITVFKRIVENNNKVDIIQGNFKSGSDVDEYVKPYVNNRFYVSMQSNEDWAVFIFDYIKKGLKLIDKDYKRVYSRSWLMANHFLASEYRFQHPDTYWTAEFSDPLMYSLNNELRTFKEMVIDDDDYISKVNREIEKLGNDYPLIENNSSAYFIAEYLIYLFADRIIFTNENQRKVMLDQFPIDVGELVLPKSEIKPHPTLDDKFYHVKDAKVDLDDDCINIAYFGKEYYGKRHFENLFYAVGALNHKFKDRIRIHLYISDDNLIKKLVPSDNFIVKKPLEYLEFLNATTKFDVLIVNDAVTKGNFELNPYLPSKLSDYRGSGRDIWAFYEEGSTLSGMDFKYKSNIGDYDGCLNQLVRILEDFGYCDEEYSVNEDYIYDRLTQLNELCELEFKRRHRVKKELKKLKKEKSSKNSKIKRLIGKN